MAHPARATPGNHVGHYEILSEVGAGGMGVVYKAFDHQLERTVALKFLPPDPICNSADRNRLLHEARAASTLDHKNIASIHAVEETEDGQLFIVMAYCDGVSLATRMCATPLSKAETVDIVRQIAEGLAHAHLHNIVHRDVKPSNVILTLAGEAKIVDFGLARFVSAGASTQTLSIAGTLSYMSPEQLSGKAVDARTDVWSLGVIAYELLTNRLPFQSDNPASTITAILQLPPAEMEGVSLELQSIVFRALAKNATDRYQSCAELLCDLKTIDALEGEATRSTGRETFKVRVPLTIPPTDKTRVLPRKRRWLTALVVALPVLIVCVLLLLLLLLKRAPPVSAAYETYLQGRDSLRRYDKPGNLDAAIGLFETTTKADPKFALAFAALGEAYWDKYRRDGDPRWVELASTSCKRAAELNDRLPAVFVTLGRIHDGTGQHNLALQEFERALELDHRDADALLGLGDAYSSTGRAQEAEDTYKRAAAMRPEYWDGYYRLGAFYYQQGRFADAASQFRRVVELLPDHAPAHTSLGTAWLSLGQEADAEAEFKKSLALAPDYPALANLGVMYYQQKRFAESAAMTEKALSLNDKDYRLWNNLAIAYEWLGQPDKAQNAFSRELARLEQIVTLKSEDADVRASLGVMYAQLHQRSRALAHLEAALAFSPDDPEILCKVGEAYEKLGERSRALEYFQKTLNKGLTLKDLELNPDLRSLLSDPSARRVLQGALPAKANPQPSVNQ
ncbi:MAG: tetratricopeptide repeat protein [Acidobacteriia bacterium]|nr:tetratricopeptide repeat protein [Terriglobia bacterium]